MHALRQLITSSVIFIAELLFSQSTKIKYYKLTNHLTEVNKLVTI